LYGKPGASHSGFCIGGHKKKELDLRVFADPAAELSVISLVGMTVSPILSITSAAAATSAIANP
jgi:hypothetical protein